MADTKISAGADPGTLTATDKVPMARSASTTAYAATVAEIAAFANGAYAPNYAVANPTMDGTAAPGVANTVSRGDHVHPTNTALLNRSGGTMTGALVLATDPAAPLQAATKQYVDGSAPAGGPYVSIANMHDVGRNLLHNPLFNVAQRGSGPFNTNAAYTADRWCMLFNGTAQVNIYPNASAATIGDEAATSQLNYQFTGTAGAGDLTLLLQNIEGVRRLSGKTVTVSFWASTGAGTLKLGVNFYQSFGSGGSPSAGVSGTGQSVTLSTTYARYSLTFAIASASGKTLGTNGDDSTQFAFWYSAGSSNAAPSGSVGVQSGTIALWGVQLEVGSVATPLDKPYDYGADLRNCQRFYQSGNFLFYGYGNAAGVNLGAMNSLQVTMRANPTLAIVAPTTSNCSALTLTAWDAAHFQSSAQTSALGGASAYGGFTASADL